MTAGVRKWNIDILIDGGKSTIHKISPRVSSKKLEDTIEHMMIYGVWYAGSLIAPHLIYEIDPYPKREEEDEHQR